MAKYPVWSNKVVKEAPHLSISELKTYYENYKPTVSISPHIVYCSLKQYLEHVKQYEEKLKK